LGSIILKLSSIVSSSFIHEEKKKKNFTRDSLGLSGCGRLAGDMIKKK
jgi:hypothetical protein